MSLLTSRYKSSPSSSKSVTSSSKSANGIQCARPATTSASGAMKPRALRANVDQQENRVGGAREGDDVGDLDVVVLDPGEQPALHEHGIAVGIGAQPVKACLAVEIAFGSVDGAGELVVEKAAAVIEPVRVGVLGVGNMLGQHAAVGDAEHVQHRILAAVLRQAVYHMPSVRRARHQSSDTWPSLAPPALVGSMSTRSRPFLCPSRTNSL